MATCGRFQGVRRLHQSGLVSVWTARPAGDERGAEAFALKLIESAAELTGEADLAGDFSDELDRFMEAAKVQKDAAAGNARFWAPIHDMGKSEREAAYVTDLFPRSARNLVVQRVTLDARALLAILQAVSGGLEELKQRCGRVHGQVRPANVLIGEGDVSEARIVLCDPAPSGRLRGSDPAKDVRDVGRLIYQLVLCKPLRDRDVINLPVPMSAEWKALGGAGKAWNDLTNRLLDSGAAGIQTLEDLGKALQNPGLRATGKGVPKIAIAAAALLLVGGGAGVAVYMSGKSSGVVEGPRVTPKEFDAAKWKALCTDYNNWFGFFVQGGGASKLAGAFPNEEAFKKAAALVATTKVEYRPQTIGDAPGRGALELADNPPPKAMEPDPAGLTAAAVDFIEKVRAELAGWAPLKEVRELHDKVAARAANGPESWREAASYLSGASARFLGAMGKGESRAASEADFIEGARDVLAAVGLARQLNESWQRLDQVSGDIETAARGAGDKSKGVLLRRFGEIVKAETETLEGAGPREKLLNLRDRLVSAATLADPVLAFVKGQEWAKVDDEAIAALSEFKTIEKKAALEKGDIQVWLGLVKDPGNQLAGANPTEGWKYVEELASVGDLVSQWQQAAQKNGRAVDPAEVKRNTDKAQELSGRAAKVAGVKVRRSNEQDIAAEVAQINNEIRSLTQRIQTNINEETKGAEEFIRSLPDRPFATDAANAEWKPRLDAARGATGEAAFKQKATLSAYRTLVESLETQSAAEVKAPDGVPPVVNRLAEARRGAALERVLKALPRDATELGAQADAWNVARQELRAWVQDAAGVFNDAEQINVLLKAGYRVGEAVEGRSARERAAAMRARPAAKDLAGEVGAGAQRLEKRLADLEDLEKETDATKLAQVVRAADAGTLAEALTAWSRLGELGESAAWPGDIEQLKLEAELSAQKLPGLLAGSGLDGARAAQLTKVLEGERPRRWRVSMENLGRTRAPTPEDIGAAMALRDSFGVKDADLAALAPWARFNLLLLDFRNAVAALDGADKEDQLRAESEKFEKAAGALGLSGREPVGALMQALTAERSAPGKPVFDPSKFGPGRVNWTVKAERDNALLTYSGPNGLTLTFARVTLPGGGVSYVQTTEMSVKALGALGGGAGRMKEILEQLPNERAREGPRTWIAARDDELRAPRPAGAADKALGWMSIRSGMENVAVFAGNIAVSAPSVEMPMQYIKPEAAAFACALAGCRLPTIEEWRAAAPGAPVSGANLRDQTWFRQWNHIKGLGGSGEKPFPSIGAFNVANREAMSDSTVWANQTDDVLFFAEVNKGGELGDFHHLVGNVAEYVVREGAALENLVNSPVVADAGPALAAAGLHVIGSSALAPPSQQPGEPQELDAKKAPRGFSDVGFRLAFSSEGGAVKSLAQRISELASQAPLLARQ